MREYLFLLWVQLHRTDWLDKLAVNVTALGSEWVLPAIAAFGLLRAWKGAKYGLEVLTAAGVMLAALAVVEILKHVIDKERPELPFVLKVYETSPSFPSAHAAMSMCVFPILGTFAGGHWWAGGVLLSLVIGLTRIYLGVHFPSDVIAGWLVGGAFAWLYRFMVREV